MSISIQVFEEKMKKNEDKKATFLLKAPIMLNIKNI